MDPVFLTVVPSSRQSDAFPVSVGWAFVRGRLESHLIRPDDGWLRPEGPGESHLDPGLGMSREYLNLHGELPRNVADRMNKVLYGQQVLTADPALARGKLSQLFATAGLRPSFRIATKSAYVAADELADYLGITPQTKNEAAMELSLLAPSGDPALTDAQYWAELWLLLRLRSSTGNGPKPSREQGGAKAREKRKPPRT